MTAESQTADQMTIIFIYVNACAINKHVPCDR